VAGDGCPRPSRQQAEPVIEAFGDLVGAEHPDLRGGQFQTQGDAVQPPADPRHRGSVGVSQAKTRLAGLGPLAEERDRVGTGQFCRAGGVFGRHR
jgi:hypothetical protein